MRCPIIGIIPSNLNNKRKRKIPRKISSVHSTILINPTVDTSPIKLGSGTIGIYPFKYARCPIKSEIANGISLGINQFKGPRIVDINTSVNPTK
jgi:hypothetical protein